MTELLRSIEDRGYPADYLLSRIKGKRSRLISEWLSISPVGDPLDFIRSFAYRGFVTERSAEGIWRDLSREYLWVYTRMNREFRVVFNPFFLFCELRTVFTCLRHIQGRGAGGSWAGPSSTLLSEDLMKDLKSSKDITAAAEVLERAFLNLSDTFAGIADVCASKGLGLFERELVNRYLSAMAGCALHPLLKEYFLRLIDSRNIIALVKFLGLGPRTAPAFLPGGHLREENFSAIIQKRDIRDILRLSGVKNAGESLAYVEPALYRNMTHFLRKAARDPLGIGPILDYLWRSSIEVMNLSILIAGRGLDRDVLNRELV